MIARRVSALLTALLTMVLTVATASLAAAADYPPDVEGTTDVQGTGVPNEVANTSAGLPHTGFDGALIWTALALVVLGVAMIVVTRRRHTHA